MDFKISEAIVKDTKQITTWGSWGGFETLLAYISREELEAMTERCKQTEWENHQKVEKLDEKKFTRQLARRVVLGWRGLTFEKLSLVLPLKQNGRRPDMEIPFDIDNAVALILGAYDYGAFVQQTVTDLQSFEDARNDTLKKTSEPLQENG